MMPKRRAALQHRSMLPASIHGARVTVGVAPTQVDTPGMHRPWGEDGAGSVVSSRTQTACVIPGGGRFWVERGEHVVVEAGPDDDPAPWLYGTVGAFVLAQQGRFALHANVVELNGRGIVIFGRRRAGKSTTSMALAGAGHRLVTDDVATLDIDGARVIHPPTGRPVHIHPQTAERLGISLAGAVPVAGDPTKLALPNPPGAPVEIASIVLLAAADAPHDSDPMLLDIEPTRSPMVLHRHAYRRGLLEPLWGGETFLWASSVAQRVPVRQLIRPADGWTVDAVRATLEASVADA
jgi:hypothetical protein